MWNVICRRPKNLLKIECLFSSSMILLLFVCFRNIQVLVSLFIQRNGNSVPQTFQINQNPMPNALSMRIDWDSFIYFIHLFVIFTHQRSRSGSAGFISKGLDFFFFFKSVFVFCQYINFQIAERFIRTHQFSLIWKQIWTLISRPNALSIYYTKYVAVQSKTSIIIMKTNCCIELTEHQRPEDKMNKNW